MAGKKKANMSREEAEELYKDLQKSMATLLAREANSGRASTPKRKAELKAAMEKTRAEAAPTRSPSKASTDNRDTSSSTSMSTKFIPGSYTAIALVLTFALVKVSFSAMEAMGVGSVTSAEASYISPVEHSIIQQRKSGTREEINILNALDLRRAELEERSRRLDERKDSLDLRDGEFASKVVQLRDLTARLQGERERNERRRSTQIEQLANVYGSMNPQEAAPLIEQLDITIALALLERMPEKRIGQILALMRPERALAITRLLSGN